MTDFGVITVCSRRKETSLKRPRFIQSINATSDIWMFAAKDMNAQNRSSQINPS